MSNLIIFVQPPIYLWLIIRIYKHCARIFPLTLKLVYFAMGIIVPSMAAERFNWLSYSFSRRNLHR